MGCGVSQNVVNLRYSIALQSEVKKGESEVRRNFESQGVMVEYPNPNIRTLQDLWKNAVTLHGNRPFLGTQINNVYQFITYSETYEYASKLGSSMIQQNLVKPTQEYKDYSLKFIGIFAKNRAEWVIIDFASILYGFTVVPFYETLGIEAIPFIVQQTNLTIIFISKGPIKCLLQIPKQKMGKLTDLVLLDEIDENDSKQLISMGYNLIKWTGLLNSNKGIEPEEKIKPESIYTLCYTSGTTGFLDFKYFPEGNPKGAMQTHKNFVSTCGVLDYTTIKLGPDDVHLSYLPLPHVMERLSINIVVQSGGSVGFYRGDPLLIKEDLARLSPTWFISVPRIFNKFYDAIKSKIDEVQGVKQSFVERAIKIKLENLRSRAEYTHFLYDKAFDAVKQLFGGRVRFMITGSAPINRDVIDFFKIAAGCPVYEGYGQTESLGASFLTERWDPQSGHVGGVVSNAEVKLVDVPEMNYTSLDVDAQGKPSPRGEICIRGHGIFAGYYKDDEKTAEAFDSEGWLHTGDIGQFLMGGNLKIIDRKKNIFKLQQGEYVAPEKIEGIYLRAKGVSEVFVYGDSFQNFCIAIVFPNEEYVLKYAQTEQLGENFNDLCTNVKVNQHIHSNMVAIGKSEKLNSLEQVKGIFLIPQSFGAVGCMTTTFKLQRHQARLLYKDQIEKLYNQLNKQLLDQQKKE